MNGFYSYKAYKPIKAKVIEVANSILNKKHIPSASELTSAVARELEKNHLDILLTFEPYKQFKAGRRDWINPTLYNWCNTFFKAYKLSLEVKLLKESPLLHSFY
jgi:hypothetical protein